MGELDNFPDFAWLFNENGQPTVTIAFRKGTPSISYIELRRWCHVNHVHASDLFNSIMEPLLYFCKNFSRRDGENNMVVTLNLGDVILRQLHPLRCGNKNPSTRTCFKYADETVTKRKKRYKETRSNKIRLI